MARIKRLYRLQERFVLQNHSNSELQVALLFTLSNISNWTSNRLRMVRWVERCFIGHLNPAQFFNENRRMSLNELWHSRDLSNVWDTKKFAKFQIKKLKL